MTYEESLREHYRAVTQRLRPTPKPSNMVYKRIEAKGDDILEQVQLDASAPIVQNGQAGRNSSYLALSIIRASQRADKTFGASRWGGIVVEASDKYGVDIVDIMLGTRSVQNVKARAEVYYRMREELKYTLPQIGRVFKKDHTTVLWAIRKHIKRMQEDERNDVPAVRIDDTSGKNGTS